MCRVTDFWHIHHLDWLSELSPRESEMLQRESSLRKYAPGEMIFAPNPEPSVVYLLEDGLVRIYRQSMSGTQTTFGYVSPGEIFGELALFGGDGRESFAEAVLPSAVRKIPRGVFQRLLAARPSLMFEVTKQIGTRFKRIESRVEQLVFCDVRTRVARILLELARDFGRREANRTVIEVALTQGDLATLVGSVRQTVNESLRQFEQKGWIGQDGRHFVLYKLEELRQAAQIGSGENLAQ
jgi:CRP/FNR family cyclic AMP-dependent transcriptional regulator